MEVSLGDLHNMYILVVARSKLCVCGLWLLGLRVRIPPVPLMSCLFLVLCVVRERSLRRADQSSREVLLSVECLECDRDASIMRRPWLIGGCCAVKNIIYIFIYLFMTYTQICVKFCTLRCFITFTIDKYT